ncbi:hypothetical protein B0H13DRAFT_2049760 [Mycena leptocephala]|nr:hypothetical protein B0H13DRAFT_2049760 [Mycena leptocephala]
MSESTTQPAPAPFIYLNGPPGTGKQTIARELVKLLPDARLIDNHLIIDLCRAIFPLRSPEYEALRSNIRNQMLSAIASSPTATHPFIFTGAHNMSNAVGHKIVGDFIAAATTGSRQFVFFLLSCEIEEHMVRATSEGRQPDPATGKQGKWVNPGGLRKAALEDTWMELSAREEANVHNLTLDTTGKTAVESAQAIVDIVAGITAANA